MASKVKDIIDIDFDPDLLTSYLEKLSLKPTIPDLKDCLSVLHSDQNKNDFSVNKDVKSLKTDNYEIKQESHSDSENENIDEFIAKNFFIKYESLSDSDESTPELHARGGPDRNKKRYSRRKNENPISVNASEFNQQSLKFLSSGHIIQNNVQPCLVRQNSITNLPFIGVNDQHNFSLLNSWSSDNEYISVSGNLFTADQSNLNYEQSSSQSNSSSVTESPLPQDQLVDNFNLYYNCKEIESKNLYTYSPESGYDTSPPSNICSPSPPLVAENQFCNLDGVDDAKEFETIIENIIELEKTVTISTDFAKELDIPKLDVQQLKDFLKESAESGVDKIEVQETSKNIINFEDIDYYEIDFLNSLENNDSSQSLVIGDISLPCKIDKSVSNKLVLQNSSNLSLQSSGNSKQRKLSFELKDDAKYALRFSEDFDAQKYAEEQKKLLKEIKQKEQNGEAVKIIYHEKDCKSVNFNRTNLHNAVLSSNVEKVYCLVEALKNYDSLFDINIRDAREKTALDYAEKLKMPLVGNYLKENNAVKGLKKF